MRVSMRIPTTSTEVAAAGLQQEWVRKVEREACRVLLKFDDG